MSDLEQMFNRQAHWQKSRQSLTWPEKIRQAERVLESVRQWRAKPDPVVRRPTEGAHHATGTRSTTGH
jgi:hypothetical protein